MLSDDRMLLGVSNRATKSDVKARWRAVALELHPDRGGSAKAFDEARAAYERVLFAAPECAICKDTGKTWKRHSFYRVPVTCSCRIKGGDNG